MLITDIETVRAYVGNADFADFTRIEPYLAEVEARELRPLLGETLFAALDVVVPSGEAQRILAFVRQPLVQLAVAEALPHLQTTLSDTGVQIQTTQTHKTAFQWQIDQQAAKLRRSGYAGLSLLIDQLEGNIEPLATAWRGTTEGKAHRRQLFTRYSEFARFVQLGSGHAGFRQLLPHIRIAESFDLVLALGRPFLDELRAQVLNRSLTADNKELLEERVWPALALLALGRAFVGSLATLGDAGAEVLAARIDATNSKEGDGGAEVITDAVTQARLDGTRYLQELRAYLNQEAGATRFATYYGSSAYTAPPQPRAAVPPVNARFF